MPKTVFIYTLNCPITGQTRYVGKAVNPQKRFSKHLHDLRGSTHRANWIHSLQVRGLTPTLEIIDEVSFELWQQWEVAYINFFRERGCDLTNATPGGEAPPSWEGKNHTPASCVKMSVSHKGKKQTPEHCKARGKGRLGKKHTAGTLAKISAANRGRKISLETLAKMSAASKGRKHSSETRVKMSTSKFGLKYKNNNSGFSGVYRNKQRDTWRSGIRFDGKTRSLGSYINLEDAVFVRALAVDKYYGNS